MKRNGFTFIEILIYVAVLGLVVAVIAGVMLWVLRSQAKTEAIRETITSAEHAMAVMTAELREAESIYDPASNFDAHPGQLSLETTKYLSADETTAFIDFFLCGGQICWKKEGQPPVRLTGENTNITNLVFLKIQTGTAPPSVQITFDIAYNGPVSGSPYENAFTLTSSASLR